MKSLIPALVLIFLLINPLFSQDDFRVIKVNGTILLKAKGVFGIFTANSIGDDIEVYADERKNIVGIV